MMKLCVTGAFQQSSWHNLMNCYALGKQKNLSCEMKDHVQRELQVSVFLMLHRLLQVER